MADNKCNLDQRDNDFEFGNKTGPAKLEALHIQDQSAKNETETNPENIILNGDAENCEENCLETWKVSNSSHTEGLPDTSKRCVKYTLATLPPELILMILSYLDARFTLRVLPCVCHLFYNLLSPESSWKTRFGHRWPSRDRREDFDYISSWKKVCVQHEDIDKFWHGASSTLDYYQLKDQHYAPVDAVHVMAEGHLCVSGSRDRTIGVWGLEELGDPSQPGYAKRAFKQSLDGHKGWVWCFSSDPTGAARVCSGSWDSKVKLWDLEGNTAEMSTISVHKAAVLCMAWRQELLVTGSYDKMIALWDLRAGHVVNMLKNHSKPVLCLDVNDKFIISGGEDKTLAVFDRRAEKVFKTVELNSPVFSLCQSSTCGYNYLRVGGRQGHMYLIDTTNDNFVELLPSMDLGLGPKGKISGMCHYGGAVVVSSTDNSITVLEPSRIPSVIQTFDCHSGEVASVHSRGAVLASGSSDLSVGIWRPKNMRPA